MIRRILRALNVARMYFKDPKNAWIYLVKEEVDRQLKVCLENELSFTEDLEDLAYHLDCYLDVPNMVSTTYFGDDVAMLRESELQRAVEREFIFEAMKRLPIGFGI